MKTNNEAPLCATSSVLLSLHPSLVQIFLIALKDQIFNRVRTSGKSLKLKKNVVKADISHCCSSVTECFGDVFPIYFFSDFCDEIGLLFCLLITYK
jgi:hypothetical protein